ncbi:MAG: hypothetical protein IJ367_00755, partial [Clostridia bacterium]|nr:hypothetical protein [Clostridia bacterium]
YDQLKNTYVTLKMSGGLGVALNGEATTQSVPSVVIKDINTSSDGVSLTVEDKSGNLATYAMAESATFQRNGAKATFNDLAIGDDADLTLTYGLVTRVMAVGKQKNTEGTVTEITISQNTSYITISKNGSSSKFALSRDCEITLQDEEATLYDLRLGAYVKLTVSSETVVKIASEAVSEDLTVTGTITTINPAYGLVMIAYENANGDTAEKQLFLKDSTKILDSKSGKLLNIKNLSVGNIITAAGTEKLGVYEVSSLMVLQ